MGKIKTPADRLVGPQRRNQEWCDRCKRFTRECTLLADEMNGRAICKKCWRVIYPTVPVSGEDVPAKPEVLVAWEESRGAR